MANPTGTPRNLRTFQKGRSGNPGGRPRGLSITRFVREELLKPSAADATVTNAELVARTVVEHAVAGDPGVVKLVWEYVDGRPADAIRATVDETLEVIATELGVDPAELR